MYRNRFAFDQGCKLYKNVLDFINNLLYNIINEKFEIRKIPLYLSYPFFHLSLNQDSVTKKIKQNKKIMEEKMLNETKSQTLFGKKKTWF